MKCLEIWGGTGATRGAVSTPGLDAWVSSSTFHNDERGGDVYYVSTCASGNVARFALADVAGHGAEASAFSTALRGHLRRNMSTPDQSALMRDLSRDMLRTTDGARFATALLATYFATTGQLILTNAGHPRPMWYRAEHNMWTALDHDTDLIEDDPEGLTDLPLGVIEPTEYHQYAVSLGEGDAVLLYTDALVEASDRDGRMLGESGLLEMVSDIKHRDPDTFLERLEAGVDAFGAADESEDDATIMLLQRNGGGPRDPSLAERFRTIGAMLGLVRV